MEKRSKHQRQFGDFQTPMALAESAVGALRRRGFTPRSVIEPTCGEGAFLLAAIEAFPNAERFVGVDINARHLSALSCQTKRVELVHADFFQHDWAALLADSPEPILILGNPPWVTSAELSSLESSNVPLKQNFQQRRGYDAITGKSNFDISEWMLLQYLQWLADRSGSIAVLCKTAVARKTLLHAWKHELALARSTLFRIDAQKHFAASVDACLLVMEMARGSRCVDCAVYDALDSVAPAQTLGYRDGIVLSNVAHYQKWRALTGIDQAYTWRSGIKHDCSKVMELEREGDKYRNAMGELVVLENDYVYPMLKSSDIANGVIRYGRKHMLVTQKYVGEDTDAIRVNAPQTWRYLESHADLFEKRASSIYRNRPSYSIFGVGDYAFSNWKVAISGFYKRLCFQIVAPLKDKAVVFDDTAYFLPCSSDAEARFIAGLLNSEPARQFLESMIFWSDKRPITAEMLRRLDLRALSRQLGCEAEYLAYRRS
jgi:hypothetical protein